MSDTQLFHARVRKASLGLMLVVTAIVGVGVLQYCRAEITPPATKDEHYADGCQRDSPGSLTAPSVG